MKERSVLSSREIYMICPVDIRVHPSIAAIRDLLDLFSLSFSLHEFFRPLQVCFLGILGVQEFFFHDIFPCTNMFLYFARLQITRATMALSHN